MIDVTNSYEGDNAIDHEERCIDTLYVGSLFSIDLHSMYVV